MNDVISVKMICPLLFGPVFPENFKQSQNPICTFEEYRLCSSTSHPLTLDAIDAAMYPEYHPYVILGQDVEFQFTINCVGFCQSTN